MAESVVPFLKQMNIQKAKDGAALALTITTSMGTELAVAIKTEDCARLAKALLEQSGTELP